MAATPSTMLPLGTGAPDFSGCDEVFGKIVSLADFASKPALLVMFICNHCPFVIHVRGEFPRLEKDYAARGLGIVAVNSNDIAAFPDDGPEHMKQLALDMKWGFPFLYDRSQAIARAYQAACTPDFFLFDRERRLVYRGQLDDSRPSNQIPVTGRDLRAAIEAVLEGRPVAAEQKPSIGCNIKWKPGNEPAYYGAGAR